LNFNIVCIFTDEMLQNQQQQQQQLYSNNKTVTNNTCKPAGSNTATQGGRNGKMIIRE